MDITYGNKEGQHFTQWRFDILEELLQKIKVGLAPLEIQEPEIWYDQKEDFHYLKFQTNGHKVKIRLNKVFGAEIDNERYWVGCPPYQINEYAAGINKKLSNHS